MPDDKGESGEREKPRGKRDIKTGDTLSGGEGRHK